MASAAGLQPTVLPQLPTLSGTIARSREYKAQKKLREEGKGWAISRNASASGPKDEVIDVSMSDDEGESSSSAGPRAQTPLTDPAPAVAAAPVAGFNGKAAWNAATAEATWNAQHQAAVLAARQQAAMQAAQQQALLTAQQQAQQQAAQQAALQATQQAAQQAAKVAEAHRLAQIATQRVSEAANLQAKVR
jgi:uncharacterized membrane protein YqiK